MPKSVLEKLAPWGGIYCIEGMTTTHDTLKRMQGGHHDEVKRSLSKQLVRKDSVQFLQQHSEDDEHARGKISVQKIGTTSNFKNRLRSYHVCYPWGFLIKGLIVFKSEDHCSNYAKWFDLPIPRTPDGKVWKMHRTSIHQCAYECEKRVHAMLKQRNLHLKSAQEATGSREFFAVSDNDLLTVLTQISSEMNEEFRKKGVEQGFANAMRWKLCSAQVGEFVSRRKDVTVESIGVYDRKTLKKFDSVRKKAEKERDKTKEVFKSVQEVADELKEQKAEISRRKEAKKSPEVKQAEQHMRQGRKQHNRRSMAPPPKKARKPRARSRAQRMLDAALI